jgi:hypothetical protein
MRPKNINSKTLIILSDNFSNFDVEEPRPAESAIIEARDASVPDGDVGCGRN